MNELCMNCQYHIQHYVKYKRSYQKIGFSHCVVANAKNIQSGQKACAQFKEIDEKQRT